LVHRRIVALQCSMGPQTGSDWLGSKVCVRKM
jgi:hypothetical protein